jgi:hypothetical protein
MKKKNGVNYSLSSKVKSRRKNVIERLEAQLKTGKKPMWWFNEKLGKKVQSPVETVPLTDHDIIRIKNELEILKTRIS